MGIIFFFFLRFKKIIQVYILSQLGITAKNMGGKENVWADTYGAKDGPIMKIRDAGWQGTLIVDSAAYAQSSWTLLKYAKVTTYAYFIYH